MSWDVLLNGCGKQTAVGFTTRKLAVPDDCQRTGIAEQGVALLSNLSKSDTAVDVNIEMMRALVRLSRTALASARLMPLIEDLSMSVDSHDAVIADIENAKK